MIRTILASIADTAIAPLQDVLGAGSDARMNLPGRRSGNWKWRYPAGALTYGRYASAAKDHGEVAL